jgi:hypothetical protein
VGSPDLLSEAARNLGVLSVELLHGVGYVEPQWGWERKPLVSLPKAILSLDKISSAGFSSLAQRGVTIKTIPHPFLSKYLPRNRHLIPKEWLFSDIPLRRFKKAILISLQWGYAGDHGRHIQFANILENGLFFPQVEELIQQKQDVLWLFRLHPRHLGVGLYQELIQSLEDLVSRHGNCEWRQASYLPYPSVVMLCSGNIGMSSQSCYDAAAMGVSSLMLCPTVQPGNIHGDWFLDLVEEGYVTKAHPDVSFIGDWIDSVDPMPPRRSNLEDDKAWDEALVWMLDNARLSSKVIGSNEKF